MAIVPIAVFPVIFSLLQSNPMDAVNPVPM
jgi:hypothetical protein